MLRRDLGKTYPKTGVSRPPNPLLGLRVSAHVYVPPARIPDTPVGPPNDESREDSLPPVSDVRVRSGRRERLLGLVFDPARHAESIVLAAYAMAVVGLAVPLVTGFDGPVVPTAVSIGLLFLSFLALFYCALVINSASGESADRPRR